MQNPFRHEDQQRRPDQNDRMSRNGERPDEYRTWGGGDGGRTAEAFRHQGHDQPREQSRASGWGSGQNQPGPYGQDMSSPSAGGGYQSGPQAYGSGPQFGQSYGARVPGWRFNWAVDSLPSQACVDSASMDVTHSFG